MQGAEAGLLNPVKDVLAPSASDQNQLIALFNAGRFVELEGRARNMVEQYPECGFVWKVLGASLLVQRREALAALKMATELLPDDFEAHSNLGATFKDLGHFGDAAASYKQALKIKPDYAEVHGNLGFVFQDLGQREGAVVSFRRALEIKPELVEAHFNFGNALKEFGRLDDAVTAYRRALEIKPDYAEAHSNLGVALQDLGQLDDAAASYRWALEIKSDFAEAHSNLGNVLQDLGQLDDAVASYRRALKIRPDFAMAHNNLGNALKDLRQFDDAVASCRRALECQLDYAEAHSNLGNALQALGQPHDAIVSYYRALEIKPDLAEAHSNLGNACQDIGQRDDAVASYCRALQINPDYIKAHSNLGNALKEFGYLDDAMASYRRALVIKPEFVEANSNLGVVLQDLGHLADAETSYRRALRIKPRFAEAHSNLLFIHNYQSDRPADVLLAEARGFEDLMSRQARVYEDWPNSPVPDRCLRVGLVSGDLRNHPVGYFIEGVLAALRAQAAGRLELIAYPSHQRTDAVTERIKANCQGWHSTVGLTDEALARRVREDGIDILIDLSGHTAHNRLPMFAWKPAPVQVSWLGYFATTGVAAIDYLIADPWTLPESEEAQFTEKIWRLPETRLCFTEPEVDIEVAPLPAQGNGYITFGCFNNLSKLNDGVVALWAQVLQAVPKSRLYLKAKQLNEASVKQSISYRFSAHGIPAERLTLEGPEPRENYLAAYNRVDIALDPFPFPGGTTSVESLWMGVPVLTLAGERFLSRQGVGILKNAGLPEWIATDTADYVKRAVEHAGDLTRLATLRHGLRQQVLASPIFDAARFAGHFEAALRGMWGQWCDPA